MKKPKPPLPSPPPLAGIVLDGANVIASGNRRALERLDLAIAWARSWRPDLPIMVFLDWATARRCRPEQQDVLRARCADVTPGRPRYAVVPPDEAADEHVLRWAREHRALVLSNDRFFDHDELRVGAVLLQFVLRGDAFEPFDEATWFRPSGGAQRVALAELRGLREPSEPTELGE
jgi:hypothetical protein